MAETPRTGQGENPAEGSEPSAHPSSYRLLRTLILAPEQERIGQIENRLDDPKWRLELVSGTLPEAVSRCAKSDDALARSIAAMVERIIGISVSQNPAPLSHALYPVMGPAIRKSIAEAFRQMVQSINVILERSLSLQGLKWRWEAIRTGRPFAEVAMMHSLVYRVEQVFLIHRETGLLMAHVAVDPRDEENAGMVSGMLTAIQAFVMDAFSPGGRSALETVQLDELALLVEQTPVVALAGVVRGVPPGDLRELFRETLERISLEYSSQISAFDGDTAPFEGARPHLQTCLESRYKAPSISGEKKRRFSLVQALGLAFLVIAGAIVFFNVKAHRTWRAYIAALDEAPGIVVLDHVKVGWGERRVRGLMDPLSPDPMEILKRFDLDPEDIRQEWTAYLSLEEKMVLERARRRLVPPESVELRIDKGVLIASGSASHAWRVQAMQDAPVVPGVAGYVDRELVDLDKDALQSAAGEVERSMVVFESGAELKQSHHSRFIEQLAGRIRVIVEKAKVFGQEAVIVLSGHTDAQGSPQQNLELRRVRAEKIRQLLIDQGIDADRLVLQDVSTDTVGKGSGSRCVSFAVRLTDPPFQRK